MRTTIAPRPKLRGPLPSTLPKIRSSAIPLDCPTHGQYLGDFLLLEGEEQEFSDFLTVLMEALRPVGPVEQDLFTQHAHASWGLRRCRRAENPTGHIGNFHESDPLITDDPTERYKLIDTYTRRAERTYERTLKQLQALQATRRRAATQGLFGR